MEVANRSSPQPFNVSAQTERPQRQRDSFQKQNSPKLADANVDPLSDKNEKEKKRRKRSVREKKPKDNFRAKVVVRRLPPNLPEEVFKKSVEKWLSDVEWFSFFPGKLSQSKGKEHLLSRAYLNFSTAEILLDFYQSYNGHVFLDSKGNENRAVVELAPNQRLPKAKKKPDTRVNTIDQDPEFLEFLESLKEPIPEAKPSDTGESSIDKLEKKLTIQQQQFIQQQQSDALGSSISTKSTPLLDDLRAKKAALRVSLERNKQINVAKRNRELSTKMQKEKGKSLEDISQSSKRSTASSEKLKSEIAKTLGGPKESRKQREKERKKAKDLERTKSQGQASPLLNDAKPPEISKKEDEKSTYTNRSGSFKSTGRGERRQSEMLDFNREGGSGRGRGYGGNRNGTNPPQASQSQTSGPRVMIMKRDGTTSTFNVGDNQ
ncbi:hypothetical protein HK096_007008 [Nowakowskiella sp. JEL0078]|nr:hypothetical protein HK096_007008 [Nowakowskiella sp. JEL0078]